MISHILFKYSFYSDHGNLTNVPMAQLKDLLLYKDKCNSTSIHLTVVIEIEINSYLQQFYFTKQ